MHSCVILMAKAARTGQAKTRLRSRFTSAETIALYRAFLRDTGDILRASTAAQKVVAYSPADAEVEVGELVGDGLEMMPQGDMDLGGRMDGMARHCFNLGADRVVIIGSDTPSLPISWIDQALGLLADRDVVLGPSTDGGYCLVGLKRPNSRIFQDIQWGSCRVLEQTLHRLEGLELALLPCWYDVDTPSDVGFLRVHLEALAKAGRNVGRHSLKQLRQLNLSRPS